jgi:hypothetical protein
MTVETLTMAAGVIISLVFSYVPGASGWFDGLGSLQKRLVMLTALFVAAAGAFGMACAGRLDLACDGNGAWQLLELWLMAAVANQATYTMTR